MLKVEYQFVEENCVADEKIECKLMLNEVEIGTAEVYLITGGPVLAAYLDQTDEYCSWVPIDAMYSIEFDGETGITRNIGYIHNIKIHKEFRGNGYAAGFLQEVENIAHSQGMETMILQPCPLEKDDENFYFNKKETLAAFYERKGYVEYETNSIMRTPYYFKRI